MLGLIKEVIIVAAAQQKLATGAILAGYNETGILFIHTSILGCIVSGSQNGKHYNSPLIIAECEHRAGGSVASLHCAVCESDSQGASIINITRTMIMTGVGREWRDEDTDRAVVHV
jgi:hypothetical protein